MDSTGAETTIPCSTNQVRIDSKPAVITIPCINDPGELDSILNVNKVNKVELDSIGAETTIPCDNQVEMDSKPAEIIVPFIVNFVVNQVDSSRVEMNSNGDTKIKLQTHIDSRNDKSNCEINLGIKSL